MEGEKQVNGTNEMRINQATMCTAVEHWLKTVVLAAGLKAKVTSVKADGTHANYNGFIVEIASPDSTEGK